MADKISGIVKTKNSSISYIHGNFNYYHICAIHEALKFNEDNKRETTEEKTFAIFFNDSDSSPSLTFVQGKAMTFDEINKHYQHQEIKPEARYCLPYFYEDIINAMAETGEIYFTPESIEYIISKIDFDDIQDIAMSSYEYPEQISTLNIVLKQRVQELLPSKQL